MLSLSYLKPKIEIDNTLFIMHNFLFDAAKLQKSMRKECVTSVPPLYFAQDFFKFTVLFNANPFT